MNNNETMPKTAAAKPLTPEQRDDLIAQIMQTLDRLTDDQQCKAFEFAKKLIEQQEKAGDSE